MTAPMRRPNPPARRRPPPRRSRRRAVASPGPGRAVLLAAALAAHVPGAAPAADGWAVEVSEDFISGARTGLAVRTPAGDARSGRALTVGCSGESPVRAMYSTGADLGADRTRLQYRIDDRRPREVHGFPGSDGWAAIVLDEAFVPRLLAGAAVRLRAIDARGGHHDAEFALDGLADALEEACGWSAAYRALAAGGAADGDGDLAATFGGLSRELAAGPVPKTALPRASGAGDGPAAPDAVGEATLELVRATPAESGPPAADVVAGAEAAPGRADPTGALDRSGAVIRREVQLRLREDTARWKARLRAAIVPHAALDPAGCAALVEIDEAGAVGGLDVEGCAGPAAEALGRAVHAASPLPLPRGAHVWRPRVGLAFD